MRTRARHPSRARAPSGPGLGCMCTASSHVPCLLPGSCAGLRSADRSPALPHPLFFICSFLARSFSPALPRSLFLCHSSFCHALAVAAIRTSCFYRACIPPTRRARRGAWSVTLRPSPRLDASSASTTTLRPCPRCFRLRRTRRQPRRGGRHERRYAHVEARGSRPRAGGGLATQATGAG